MISSRPIKFDPYVTLSLIGVCVLIYACQGLIGTYRNNMLVLSFGMIPAILFGKAQLSPDLIHIPPLLTSVTHLFLHASWVHLFVNMAFLAIFGPKVEVRMGHLRFILFFLACGAFAAIAQALVNPSSSAALIGASGGISGILGACVLLFYHQARVLTGALLFYFFMQFINSMFESASSNIAWSAHLAGFVFGMILTPFVKRRAVATARNPHSHAANEDTTDHKR